MYLGHSEEDQYGLYESGQRALVVLLSLARQVIFLFLSCEL